MEPTFCPIDSQSLYSLFGILGNQGSGFGELGSLAGSAQMVGIKIKLFTGLENYPDKFMT